MKNSISAVEKAAIRFNGGKAANASSFPQEFMDIITEIEKKQLLSPKYLKLQKEDVSKKSLLLLDRNPEISAKDLFLSILNDLPEELPAWNLSNVCNYIGKIWEQHALKQQEMVVC